MSKVRDRAEQIATGFCFQIKHRLGPKDAIAWLQDQIEIALREESAEAYKIAAMKAGAREMVLRQEQEMLMWLAEPGTWKSRFDDVMALLAERPDAGFVAALRRAMQRDRAAQGVPV